MPTPLPRESKELYNFLVDQAERYIRRRPVSVLSLRLWRNRALDWLKRNAPNSDLADALLVVPVKNIQRGLAVFLRAKPVVPFLRDNPNAVVPKPTNTKKVFIVHGRNDALKNSVARFLG